MDQLKKVVGKHAVRLGVDPEIALGNILLFAKFVGIVENADRTIGCSNISSARGLYQYVVGSIRPAINRLRRTIDEGWMDLAIEHRDANLLTRDQQTLMFVADILERRGSDKYTKGIMLGDKEAAISAYKVLHHTDPDEATIRRVNRISRRIYVS